MANANRANHFPRRFVLFSESAMTRHANSLAGKRLGETWRMSRRDARFVRVIGPPDV
jgi:hypothetical protein